MSRNYHDFSDFFVNAPDDEQKEVMSKAVDKANKEQQDMSKKSQSNDRQKLEELFAEFISDVPFNSDAESQHKAADKFLDSIQSLIEQSNQESRLDEAQRMYTNYIPTGTLTARAARKRIKKHKDNLAELQHPEGRE